MPWYCAEAAPVYRGLICSVSLVVWPVADPHYSVTCLCPAHELSVRPSPIPGGAPCAPAVTDTEGDTPSLSPLAVLPEEPVTFRSNAPVIGASPPCLRDAKKIQYG